MGYGHTVGIGLMGWYVARTSSAIGASSTDANMLNIPHITSQDDVTG